jgi:hypothetical protein
MIPVHLLRPKKGESSEERTEITYDMARRHFTEYWIGSRKTDKDWRQSEWKRFLAGLVQVKRITKAERDEWVKKARF